MLRENISDLKKQQIMYQGDNAILYTLADGRIFKQIKPFLHHVNRVAGCDYESRLYRKSTLGLKDIVGPQSIVYDKSFCCGYTMEYVPGCNLNQYEQTFSLIQRSDLNFYYFLYSQIENIVIKANRVGIVIPDLLTLDNIMVKPGGEICFVDYDGMQVGIEDRTIMTSTSLGDINYFMQNPKFMPWENHFSPELDKVSLVYLIFLFIFNIDLNSIGVQTPQGTITLTEIFNILGIEDEEFKNKVASTLSPTDEGFYMQDELYKLAKKYRMYAFQVPNTDFYIKRLALKK